MSAILSWRRIFLGVLLLTLVSSALVAQEFRLFERAWFWLSTRLDPDHAARPSLDLDAYQVQIEALEIPAAENVSALTFDPDRRSLFTVTNRNPELIELSLEGQILRRIPMHGFTDPEAIEYIAPGQYVICDEREQTLIAIRLDDATTELHADDFPQFSLGVGLNGNKGFEGLAYDFETKRLFAAKEREPARIYEVTGFPQQAQGPGRIQVRENRQRDERLFLRDISSLHFEQTLGHLLVLSDESRLVIEMDAEGHPVSTLSLLSGNQGLQESVPQAEGMAMDDNGTLYIVSEPNLFYSFRAAK